MKVSSVKSALILLLALAACTKKPGNEVKTLPLALTEDVKYADPAQAADVLSSEINANIFETLLKFKYPGSLNELEPQIAEEMPTISKDGLSYSFKIRKGVFFQDDPAFPNGQGRELVANDFVYSFKRVGDPRVNSQNFWMFDGMIEGLDAWKAAIEKEKDAAKRSALFDQPVSGLQAPDAHTFVIRLTRPYPQLKFILAMNHASAMAREVVEKYGPEIGNHPVGTGPYRLKEWQRGLRIVLEQHPRYHGTPGVSPRIEWHIIKEEQPLWLKFMRGEIAKVKIPKDNYAQAIDAEGNVTPELKSKGISLLKASAMTAWWIEFNQRDPVLGGNKKLRQALATAFDRSKALAILYNNRGTLSKGPLVAGIEGADELPPYPWEFNLEKAKQLLAEAGFPGGKGAPEITIDLRGPGTTPRQLGEFLKKNWESLGLKVGIRANSYPEALEKQRKASFQVMLGGWVGDYPDPENYLQLFYSKNAAPGSNSSNFKNKEYDSLYEQIRTQQPSPDRRKAIVRMVAILQEEVPAAFFFEATDFFVAWPWLKNYQPNPLNYGYARYLDVAR